MSRKLDERGSGGERGVTSSTLGSLGDGGLLGTRAMAAPISKTPPVCNIGLCKAVIAIVARNCSCACLPLSSSSKRESLSTFLDNEEVQVR
jgi:hypothetical protein